jgi:hypothetical protein
MTEPNISEIWEKILDDPERMRLTTCYGVDCTNNYYDDFTTEKPENKNTKTFVGKTELFVTALLIGYIYDKPSDMCLPEKKAKRDMFRRANALKGKNISDLREIARLIFLRTFPKDGDENMKRVEKFKEYSNKSESEEITNMKAILQNLCSYADGGIEIIINEFAGKFDLDNIRTKLNSVMDEKVPELIAQLDPQKQK